MSKKVKRATETEWRALGEQAKLCDLELVKLADMAYRIMPVRVGDRVLNLIVNKHLLRFRSEAEDEMFRRGGPQDTSVFW